MDYDFLNLNMFEVFLFTFFLEEHLIVDNELKTGFGKCSLFSTVISESPVKMVYHRTQLLLLLQM